MLDFTNPRKGKRDGQTRLGNQTASAAPHTDPAPPESRLDQSFRENRQENVEAAPIPVPGDAGRESGHIEGEAQVGSAALATSPAQVGAGESQGASVTQTRLVSPAKSRRAPARRGAIGRLALDVRVSCADSANTDPAMPEDLARHCSVGSHSSIASEVTSSEIGSNAEGESGHFDLVDQKGAAALATPIPSDGEGGVGHCWQETQASAADPAIILEIREQWRRRQAWHRAEKSLTLQAKALCRRLATDGDKDEADVIYKASQGEGSHPMAEIALAATFPLTEARDGVERHRLLVEARLRKLAKKLPVASWVISIHGASLNTLAAVVGEAGDIGVFPYTNPAKLWKRMGLAVMPDGTRQRRVGGEDGIEHGYSPKRRSVMWNIGGSLIGGLGRGPRLRPDEDPDQVETLSPLQRLFVKRIRYEVERDPSHARPITKLGKESFSKHAAARAKRYVEKRFLLLLWKEWRRADERALPMERTLAANSSFGEQS